MAADDVRPALVVHGGAGDFSPEAEPAARSGISRALDAGVAILAAGGAAIDAAQAAVRVLEDDPTFNAGTGASLNRDGGIEVDAAIMEGRDLRIGAVASMPYCDRAILVARHVLEDGRHVLLCGDGAWELAREHGIQPADAAAMTSDRARDKLARARAAGSARDPGTVGAVACDLRGDVAAATSTGGTTNKRPGRIGDTPLCGCGTYADNLLGAASATGIGEAIIRVTMARSCCHEMEQRSAAEAARRAVAILESRVAGAGGIICVDRRGGVGAFQNTADMPWGAARPDGARTVGFKAPASGLEEF